jgi:peptide/nickel transport system substrate-binding protein
MTNPMQHHAATEPSRLLRLRDLDRRELLRYAGAGAGALSLTALLAACGADGSGGATAPTASTAKAKKGGTLTMLVDGAFDSAVLDPYTLAVNTSMLTVACGIFYEQVTQMNEDNVLQMHLAEEITHNADGSQWTVRLKKGIEFHNGKTLTADDLIFSLKRMAAPATFTPGILQIGSITTFTKLDQYTVRLDFKTPRGWVDIGFGDGGITGIVPEDFDPKNPVGTGPFMIEKMEAGSGVTFKRFDNYFGDAALLDRLVVKAVGDPSARLNALTSGQADLVTPISGSQITQVKGNSALRLYSVKTGAFIPFQMRTDTGPTKDVNVRQALRYAIDRDQVVTSAYAGQATKGNDVFSIYDPDFTDVKKFTRERDLDQAKSLFAKSGLGSTPITLTTMSTGSEQAQVMAQNASEAGITVKVNTVDSATLYSKYIDWQFMTGDFFPNSRYLVTSSGLDAPGAGGLAHFDDKEHAALWNEASATFDDTKRRELINEMQTIESERGAYIIPAFYNEVAGASTKVAGLPEHDVTGLGIVRHLAQIGFTK